MNESGTDSRLFEELTRELLERGVGVRFRARGASMSPAIRDGEMVEITPVIVSKLRKDDIVLAKSYFGFRLHRIVCADHANDRFITRGDCGQQDDPALRGEEILGLARAKEVRVGRTTVQAQFHGVIGWTLRSAARGQQIAEKILHRGSRRAAIVRGLLGVLALVILVHSISAAQVAVDNTSSGSTSFTGTGAHTLTIAHTTTATANRLLLVGVDMNINGNNGTTVTGVTYNGTALTEVGAHQDAGNSRRVEMWSLLAPASVTANVAVTVNLAGNGRVAVVAGATTFTDVDQTVPLGTFVSADGANAAYSQLDVPSVVNGMVLDTLAISGADTITVPAWQNSQWNVTSAGGNTVTGSGSSRPGEPSLPFSETFSGDTNWSMGAVSINPSTADVAVSTSVSAVEFGQNSTYNITVTNNGPSAANNVTLTDAFADTNLSLVSYTPSAGMSCTIATTINCTLPTPFASGATATLSVVVSASVAGYYPNTATITDSGAPPDPNTGNDSYVALAPVLSVVCSTTSPPAGGTLSGTINTYYPGTASVNAGQNLIPVGAANGTGTIAAGDELLVIQMQNASINLSDNVAYGNGYTGAGFTTVNGAGNYEFVTATGPVSGGSVPIQGAGAGGGLVFSYTASAASATQGQSTYQVVLVPQYATATLGALTATAWNGSTGGIIALDVGGALALGGATVHADGVGFRGGAGLQLGGGGGSNTDFLATSPATYTPSANGNPAQAGWDGPKGEGIAGTPMWIQTSTGPVQTTTGVGYPSGTAGVDGSMARGAPGNAGGGGTDADPQTAFPGGNDQNVGGGGGGNGGAGGFGGDSWDTNLALGGEGGAPFPATIDRIALGGGGGAATRNNSGPDTQASGGSAGGGIIFIRADSFTGTATLTANGADAYNDTANDGGGGGGAGGTIVILAANGGEGNLTLQANGGTGGNAWDTEAFALTQRHGPGGGGGGGVIFVSGTPASVSVAGGANGGTLTTLVPYGSTPGASGTSVTNATLAQVTGTRSEAICTHADLSISKTHGGGSLTRGTNATYTIQVSNISPLGATSGLVTVNDTFPAGLTPTSYSATGWNCSISGQTVSCTNSNVLAANSSYPAITITASVLQSAPATLVNTAVVNGGGSLDNLDNTATDVASVVSSADLSVTDAGSPNPVAAGGNITYTQVVTNNGPSAVDNAQLFEAIPANTTFVSLTVPAGWTCSTPSVGGAGNIVCNNVSMSAVTSSGFGLVVNVNSATANGTIITDVASVTSSVSDPNPLNNTVSVSTEVGSTANAQLSVTNVASPNPVQQGNDITYTQVVTNTGSSAATSATFTENTPGNTTFVKITAPGGWSCTGFPTTCTNPSVPAGASGTGTFTVVYQVSATASAGSTISDTATVNASNQAFGANSATATDVVASGTQADVALGTVATPSSVLAGNNITYTQTVTNNGPAAATNVSFTEATPANTTFQSVLAPTGWTCTQPAVGATGTVNCTDTSLASGIQANIIVVVNVPATVPAGTITANSSVTATTSDPNNANNNTTVTTTLFDNCNLAVANSGTPNPAAAGGQITYTQVVTNSGPSSCSAGTLGEATPASTTFVSVSATTTGGGTWTCPNSAPVACTNPSVVPGSVGTITAIYQVSATATGTITDTVNVSSSTTDTNLANNTATVNIPIATSTQADLAVSNSGTPNPVAAGGTITYTQTVTNNGPGAAAAAKLAETLPANVTFVSLTGPGGTWSCTTTSPYQCTDSASMASSGATSTASFTLTVTVSSTLAAGTALTETAGVSSSTSDPNSSNNNASVTTYVSDSADVSITNALSATPTPPQDSSVLTYTQVVKNVGPSTATGVQVTESLPTDTSATSLSTTATGWTCTLGTLTCSNPSLAPNATATITFTATVSGTAPAGTALSQTATVSSSTSDPNLANNSATVSSVVAGSTQANLVVTNSAAPTSVAAGSDITYTQTVQNLGPAAATTVSFTQTTPPNTTFVSMTGPGGTWNCTSVPAAGGTGTVTCTDATFNTGTASFKLILQVNSTTPSGTSITDTATATASNIVPNLTTNTASATVVVANANSADMAIVKTATPNPVNEGTPLTYTLTVTNNGPASATTVIVTDTLPSSITYLSSAVTPSVQGSCSEANGVVTCLLGTMDNGVTATINIVTIPQQPGVISNTATVSADQTDPTSANNTSTQTETVTYPTVISLQSFTAHVGNDKSGASRLLLTWKTGGEAHNLGFNLYRELNGNRVRVNSSLIAGSALLMSGALPKHSAKSYAWIDPSPATAGTSYWLEDVDVNGIRTMHGPISAEGADAPGSDAITGETTTFQQISQAQVSAPQDSHVVEAVAKSHSATSAQMRRQFDLAAHPAVKILVQHEGWYRITQPQLVEAGLDPNVDASTLHLYAEAVEQPMQITGAAPGRGRFGAQAAIQFYGTGIDTEFSGTRVYWLVAGEDQGARIPVLPMSSGSNQPPASYRTSVELSQHTTYFAALLTKNDQNFFGALVSSTPAQQTIYVSHLDANSTQDSRLDIALQGAITGYPHDVSVVLNGSNIGDVIFTGRDKGHLSVPLPPGSLQEGNNSVTLAAQDGEYDTSLVEFIRISYPHKYVADSDQLKFIGRAGDEIVVSGFSGSPVVIDVTDPAEPVQLAPQVATANGNYSFAIQVPWTTTNSANPVWHRLLAVASDHEASPAGLRANHPSHWNSVQVGADIAMVSYDGFAGALESLVRDHDAEGQSSAVIPVSELYDEFTFGEHSPYAIREFLRTASHNWKRPPHYLLLNGRASFDPRNYLGMGELDLVPTDIFPSSSLMTASDDWFSDFSNTGMPTIATGRIPAATLDEDRTAIEKIAGYEHSQAGSWSARALMVADRDDNEDFSQDAQTVQSQLPARVNASDIFVGVLGAAAAQQELIDGINSGQLLVNYLGHGSEEQWSGSDILDTKLVDGLTNGSQLPVFLIMDCLNGFFQDVYAQSLGVTLLLAPNGGAVAVLASSGLNQPAPQTQLDRLVVGNAFNKGSSLGESIVKAKSQISDEDVRRTFILFGDPAMQIKQPSASAH